MKIIVTPNWPNTTPVSFHIETNMSVDCIDNRHLEYLFRQLNAVDGKEMVTLFNIAMPSLSVKDEIEFIDSNNNSRKYVCAPFGWNEITQKK